MDLHKSFRMGAERLASAQYGEMHKEYGISEVDWALVTQEEHWTHEQMRQSRSVIASIVEVALTVVGMPPVPLPAQYVAAVIAIVVAPANRLVAAMKAPDTFDAFAASGLQETIEVKPATREQMMSLVIAYSGGFGGEPMPRVQGEVVEMTRKANEK